jgi:hypothetical protein
MQVVANPQSGHRAVLEQGRRNIDEVTVSDRFAHGIDAGYVRIPQRLQHGLRIQQWFWARTNEAAATQRTAHGNEREQARDVDPKQDVPSRVAMPIIFVLPIASCRCFYRMAGLCQLGAGSAAAANTHPWKRHLEVGTGFWERSLGLLSSPSFRGELYRVFCFELLKKRTHY